MWSYRTYGIPDEMFDKLEGIVMTKEEVRVISISKMRIREGDVVVDIGCGTGSIAIELANIVGSTGVVYAIDRNEKAIEIAKRNATRFGVDRVIRFIHGEAPNALSLLPRELDAVFIGGSSGRLDEIIAVAFDRLRYGRRIVLNLTLLENIYTALSIMKKLGMKLEVVMVQVARGEPLGYGLFLRGGNPVFIIAGEKT
ncbi:MAG: precorrin-6Y C5,15-methyltransferase (decarboxylating) subunit CbiT [Ignisphaera sp.]